MVKNSDYWHYQHRCKCIMMATRKCCLTLMLIFAFYSSVTNLQSIWKICGSVCFCLFAHVCLCVFYPQNHHHSPHNHMNMIPIWPDKSIIVPSWAGYGTYQHIYSPQYSYCQNPLKNNVYEHRVDEKQPSISWPISRYHSYCHQYKIASSLWVWWKI